MPPRMASAPPRDPTGVSRYVIQYDDNGPLGVRFGMMTTDRWVSGLGVGRTYNRIAERKKLTNEPHGNWQMACELPLDCLITFPWRAD